MPVFGVGDTILLKVAKESEKQRNKTIPAINFKVTEKAPLEIEN
jgi:hypothetical protein